MPFSGKSNYADTFIPPDLSARAQRIKGTSQTAVKKPFIGITSKMVDFKPFKVESRPKTAKNNTGIREFSYPGQYMSTTHKDFNEKRPMNQCIMEGKEMPPELLKASTYFNPVNKIYYV